MNKKKILLVTFALLLSLFGVSDTSAQKNLVIRNVGVVSMKSPRVERRRDVFIENGRILRITKSRGAIPENFVVIDGTNKFLMPGLWDMHVHAWDANLFFPLMLSNGITGIRDMGGVLEPYLEWRKKTASDTNFYAPKSFVGGQILNGTPSSVDFFVYADTPEKGREKVRELKRRGADFIKVYSFLRRDIYEAIVDEAFKQNITFAGHVPFTVKASEASAKGQRSIEHLRGIALEAAKDEDERRTLINNLATPFRNGENKNLAETRLIFDLEERLPDGSLDRRKFAALARTLRKNNTYVSPTLVVLRGAAQLSTNPNLVNDERLRYFPSYIKNIILLTQKATAKDIEDDGENFAKSLDLVRMLHQAKVKIIAGSDAPNPYTIPAFALHEELEFYVRAGMSPYEALRTATVNAAEFVNKTDDFGTIAEGKIADLVLLEANPLVNISNTRQINAVFLNGRYLSPEKLKTMREKVAESYKF